MPTSKINELPSHNKTHENGDRILTERNSTTIKQKLQDDINLLNKIPIKVPNFLIIGVQKGGTTWLHENLKSHPQIVLPNKKELEFFSYYQKKVEQNGWSEYLSHINKIGNLIRTRKNPIAIGEVTPSYFWSTSPERKWTNPPRNFNSNIPTSVLNTLGSRVKLIVSLRNPVDRAISAYLHHVRHNRILPKEQSILDVGHLYGIVDMGFYYQHFQKWLEVFTIDNFKILLYEQNIKRNKQKTIEEVCEYLEVDCKLHPTSTNLEKFHNKGLQYFEEKGQIYIVENEDSAPYLAVNKDEIKQLKIIYKDEVTKLARLVPTDLFVWNFD